MRILPLIQGPAPREAHFYRNVNPKGCFIGITAGVVILSVMVYFHWAGKIDSFGIYWLLPVSVIAFGGIMLHYAIKPTNWILAVGPSKLWIKYRSNRHGNLSSEDPQVIELSYDEIALAGLLTVMENKSKREICSGRFLVLTLSDPIDMSLKKAIYAERQKVKKEKLSVEYLTVILHHINRIIGFPVSLHGDNEIEVGININDRKKLQQELQQHGVAIASHAVEKINHVKPPEEKHQLEVQLIRMIERGEDFGLVHFAAKGLKIPQSEAEKYIEELNRRVWETDENV